MILACAQSDVIFADPEANAANVVATLRREAALGTDLVLFPEAFLTGYCVESREEARQIAIPVDHPALVAIARAVEETNLLAVVGFAELDGEVIYNTAALFEPGVPPRYFRKIHLPDLGLDFFVTAGDRLEVFDTRLGRIGILICFDMRPPEATRVLVLEGADLVLLPTNWPEGAQISANHIAIARAAENRVFFAACNRVGLENGFRFIGRSKIINPNGIVLANAADGEETLRAEFDITEARQKRNVVIPGRYETAVIGCRRPELYQTLSNASHNPTPQARG